MRPEYLDLADLYQQGLAEISIKVGIEDVELAQDDHRDAVTCGALFGG